jgi:hypothetical protein
MLNETEMKNLSVITIDGKDYLGVVKTEKDHVEIKDVMGCKDGFSTKTLRGYLKYKNLDKLKVLTHRGETTFIERKLTNEELTEFFYLDKIFEQSKKDALKQLENDMFEKACAPPQQK